MPVIDLYSYFAYAINSSEQYAKMDFQPNQIDLIVVPLLQDQYQSFCNIDLLSMQMDYDFSLSLIIIGRNLHFLAQNCSENNRSFGQIYEQMNPQH